MAAADVVVRWTPNEGWLMAEVARRGLAARGPDREILGADRFEVTAVHGDDGSYLAIVIDSERATLELADADPHGHRWRDTWMLEIICARDGTLGWLSSAIRALDLGAVRGRELRAVLRIATRAIKYTTGDGQLFVPTADVAFHRYTRQSSLASSGPPLGWAMATRCEPAPWWELDLGAPMFIDQLRFEFTPIAGARAIVYGHGYLANDGGVVANTEVAQAPAARGTITCASGFIARYLRLAIVNERASELEVTHAEVFASELFADELRTSLRRAFARFADRPLVLERDGDGYRPAVTYQAVWQRARAIAAVLVRHAAPSPMVAIALATGADWIAADVAAVIATQPSFPVGPDEADDRLAAIFALAKPTIVLCGRGSEARMTRLAANARVIVVDDIEAGEFAATAEPWRPDAPYSILFTSGSTGTPKGAVRSYRSFHQLLKSHPLGHAPRHLSFQPVWHFSERVYLPSLIIHGGQLAFSRGGAYLFDELRALGPTTIGTVPRLFDLLYANYRRRLAALISGAPGRPRGELEQRALAEARTSFGPRLQAISVGSAPVSAEVLGFIRRCFADIWVSEGYGSTELGTIATNGRVPDDVVVRLVPGPDRGEIFVRSPHAIIGYLGDAPTAATFDAEGYFATGDLGERAADGTVRVVGRVGNTVKLANGEFVAVEPIERELATAPIVDQICVIAQPGADSVAAVVVPIRDRLAELVGCDPDRPLVDLVVRDDAGPAVLAALNRHARGLASWEMPRSVVLEATPWSTANGGLTASGKLARAVLGARYRAAIAGAPSLATIAQAVQPVDDLERDLEQRVIAIASRVAGRPIKADEPIATSGIESLAVSELLGELSDELARDVPLHWWFDARTLGDLITRLARFGAGARHELVARARAQLTWQAPAVAPRRSQIARVLVTGATGFLGSHLIEALSARGFSVVGLARAPSPAAARERITAALARNRCRVTGELEAVAGDLAASDLVDRLAELDRIDAIVHAGATVSWLAPFDGLVGPNVAGTRELLAFGARCGAPFHHVSTISVAPSIGDEQAMLTLDEVAGATPYALTKWLAEQVVRTAGDRGLPVTIYRPAMIAAHSARGIGNPDDYLSRYLATCRDLAIYIDRDDAIVDMTPVDFVAEAIAAVVASDQRGTYHLANVDQSLSYRALGSAADAAGYPMKPVSHADFCRALSAAPTARLAPLAAFVAGPGLGMGPWPCGKSVAALASLGVTRPRIDHEIIARYMLALPT